jgi:hypothetical protein
MEVNARFERAKEESAAMNTNTKSSECRNEAVFDSTLERVAGLNWAQLEADLNSDGFATTPILLEGSECRETVALYADEDRFRSRIVMDRCPALYRCCVRVSTPGSRPSLIDGIKPCA